MFIRLFAFLVKKQHTKLLEAAKDCWIVAMQLLSYLNDVTITFHNNDWQHFFLNFHEL